MVRHAFGKCVAAALLSGCLIAAQVAAADTIKIGVAGPHTGSSAAIGEQFWRGASQAAADINAAGGINGKKIELVKGDDACEPKQAVAVANRLVDVDKVKAVVGHYCSSSTLPASDIYADAGILMMTPGSTNPKITERGLTTVFRMCGRDDQQGTVAANFVVKTLKAKRIALIHDKDTYGQGLVDAFKTQIKKLGVKEVLYEGLTRGEKDFNALVTKVKAAKADTVYFGGLHTEAGPLVRQLREQGLKVNFISGDGINTHDLVTAAGGKQFVDGIYMTFGLDARNLPSGKEVLKKFRAAKIEPEGYTLYSYATLQSIAAAMKATKSTDGKKLADWLHKNKVNTVMGPKEWNAKGDIKVSDFIMYRWDATGTNKEVK